jgi:hypothetical protein
MTGRSDAYIRGKGPFDSPHFLPLALSLTFALPTAIPETSTLAASPGRASVDHITAIGPIRHLLGSAWSSCLSLTALYHFNLDWRAVSV